MASLDFVVDVAEKIKSQGIKYFIITLQENKTNKQLKMFHYVPDDSSLKDFQKVFVYLGKNLKEICVDSAPKAPKKKKKK